MDTAPGRAFEVHAVKNYHMAERFNLPLPIWEGTEPFRQVLPHS